MNLSPLFCCRTWWQQSNEIIHQELSFRLCKELHICFVHRKEPERPLQELNFMNTWPGWRSATRSKTCRWLITCRPLMCRTSQTVARLLSFVFDQRMIRAIGLRVGISSSLHYTPHLIWLDIYHGCCLGRMQRAGWRSITNEPSIGNRSRLAIPHVASSFQF